MFNIKRVFSICQDFSEKNLNILIIGVTILSIQRFSDDILIISAAIEGQNNNIRN